MNAIDCHYLNERQKGAAYECRCLALQPRSLLKTNIYTSLTSCDQICVTIKIIIIIFCDFRVVSRIRAPNGTHRQIENHLQGHVEHVNGSSTVYDGLCVRNRLLV